MSVLLTDVITEAKSLLPNNYVDHHFDAIIKNIATRVVRDIYEKHKWRFLMVSGTIVTVNNTRDYLFPALAPVGPTGYEEVQQYLKFYIANDPPLEEINYDVYLSEHLPHNLSGKPKFCAVGESTAYQDKIYFDPRPNGVYTVNVIYYKAATPLDGDGEEETPYIFNEFPDNHRSVIVDLSLAMYWDGTNTKLQKSAFIRGIEALRDMLRKHEAKLINVKKHFRPDKRSESIDAHMMRTAIRRY